VLSKINIVQSQILKTDLSSHRRIDARPCFPRFFRIPAARQTQRGSSLGEAAIDSRACAQVHQKARAKADSPVTGSLSGNSKTCRTPATRQSRAPQAFPALWRPRPWTSSGDNRGFPSVYGVKTSTASTVTREIIPSRKGNVSAVTSSAIPESLMPLPREFHLRSLPSAA
jgi:hypothetical protein